MSKLIVRAYSISLDGYGAGPKQDRKDPLGVGGEELHKWMFPTNTFKSMYGGKQGTTGVDDAFARKSFENVGSWIMGRNMFGPIRGEWNDPDWKGWWGDNPPYHTPVYVLTHHRRDSLAMQGNTTFHFVTDGIEEALARARKAADGKDVRLLGGAATIRQYLLANLVDEMHVAVSPVLLGTGEHLLAGIDLRARGFEVVEHVSTEAALHVVLRR
jgi:dihydrofolate reductase